MKKNVFISLTSSFLLLSLLVLSGVQIAAAQTNAKDEVKLSTLVTEAAENNPRIAAARDKWQSAAHIIDARKAFPDPQLSYTYFIESIETRVGPQKNVVGLKQTFPFYGKRGLRGEIAGKEAEALEQEYKAVEREIVSVVKKQFYEYFYLSKAIQIAEDEKALLKHFEQIAITKYETGAGLQQNILKVQVEISKLNDRLLELRKQKQTAEALINTLLNRPAHSPLGKPVQPEFRKFFFDEWDLINLATENRQELKAAQYLIEKSQKAYDLAKKDYFPDITLGATYFQIDKGPLNVSDNGQDALSVTLSINLPIWFNKYSSQAESALEMVKAQEKSHESILNQTLFEVKDYLFKLKTARDTVDLYKNALLPQAEQSMKSAEAGYVTGIVSFLDLLDAERILLMSYFGYWRGYADYLKYIADLERTVGVELGEAPTREYWPESVEE